MPNGERPRQEDQEQEQPEQKPTPEEVSRAASVLGIQPGATEGEIDHAFRNSALKYDPDITGGDKQRFQAANDAFLLLERAIRTGAWEQQEQPEQRPATEGLPEKFKRDIDALAEQGRIIRERVEKIEDKNFKRFGNNKYIRAAVVYLVLIGAGIGIGVGLFRREGVSKVESRPTAAAKLEEAAPEKAAPEEVEKLKGFENEVKEAAPEEEIKFPSKTEGGLEGFEKPAREYETKRTLSDEDISKRIGMERTRDDLETAKIDERAVLEAFYFFVKDSTAEKIDENSFAVDIGGRDYHCYKVTPEDLALIRDVQEHYHAKVKTFILDKKQKPFASGKLRQGFKERAEREIKKIIRTYCEKIDEVSPEQIPDKIKEAQQERREIEKAKTSRVKVQIERERAKRQV